MRRFLILTSLIAALFLSPSFAKAAEEIWFVPPDNLPRGTKVINDDFPHLFDKTPQWRARADVFSINPLYAQDATEDDLRQVAAFVSQYHMLLAVGIGSAQVDNVDPVEGECRGGEGLTRPRRNLKIFSKLKRFGLNVQYVAMDEPLTFAYYHNAIVTKQKLCHYSSLQEVARRVAASVAEIRQSYPDVKVVEYEAPLITSPQQWAADLPAWLAAYKEATGTPLDAMAFDIKWTKPWQDVLANSVRIVHNSGVRAGVFLDGTAPNVSDADAIATYKQNAQSVDALRLPLDLALVANWTPHPSRNLPESDPDTLTSFLRWYETLHGR